MISSLFLLHVCLFFIIIQINDSKIIYRERTILEQIKYYDYQSEKKSLLKSERTKNIFCFDKQ